jgi:AcrR family transcriptional regulator
LATAEGESEPRRPYDAPRRREQAIQTRAEIAAAARHLFTSRGWGQTTVRDIAKAARVSEPTVYKAYGGKAGLAGALVDAVDLAADVARQLAELEAAQGDPPAQLAAMVAFDRRLFERGADVIRLLREAARTEPDLAAAYQDGRDRGETLRRQVFSSWPAKAFRSGVDVSLACDTYAALCTVDTYATLTGGRRSGSSSGGSGHCAPCSSDRATKASFLSLGVRKAAFIAPRPRGFRRRWRSHGHGRGRRAGRHRTATRRGRR